MSLRLRLILVIIAVVTLMGIVGLMSFQIHRRVQQRLVQLSRMSMVGLGDESLVGQALEIKGYWDGDGHFIAVEIQMLSRTRRPKLRGEIEETDRGNKRLTLFGRRITVNDETEFLYSGEGDEPFDSLKPGGRVEVSCKVDKEGGWIARKIETRAVKKSDKVKGIITRADMGRGPQHRLEIHGLQILVDRGIEMINPRSPLYLMENATQMTLSVRECLSAVDDLIKGNEDGTGRAAEFKTRIEEVEGRLVDGYEDFVQYLSESRSAVEEVIRSSAEEEPGEQAAAGREKMALWLDPLEERRAAFGSNVSRFRELGAKDLEAARTFLRDVMEPHLEGEILPLVQAYHLETEEDLSDELQAVSSRSEAAARLAIAINLAGAILALVLGFFVYRSISRPVLALKEAAEMIGRGNLEMRVDVRSRDEIGVLASAFNWMAGELAASMVSVKNLNSVIDSMAGALLILTPDEKIRSVNPAALALLGYETGDLIGQTFETICPNGNGIGGAVRPTEEGLVSAVEKVFRRKDGAELPVSFSGAALRDEKGSVRGFVCIAQDLTEHKGMEKELRRSLSEKELLLKEVHHRVKNNLQVISSLLDLQSRNLSDPKSMELFQESQDRILSMVLIHDQLYRSRDIGKIDFRSYLEHLVANLIQSHGELSNRIRLQVRVEDLDLDIDRALACGLIVNELVTNAFKHAFPGNASGEILVSSCLTEQGECVLEVSDNGRGLDEDLDPEGAESLGLSLVSTLVDQLRGRLLRDGRSGRVVFRAEFPVKSVEEVA